MQPRRRSRLSLHAIRLVVLVSVLAPAIGCGGGGSGDGGSGGGGEDPPVVTTGPEIRLNTDPEGWDLSLHPEIAGEGDRVYVVWYDRRSGNTDVHFNRSIDGGANWLATDARLDTDVAGAAGSNVPRLDADGDAVFVVWSDQRSGASQIRFNRSLDAGSTWFEDDVRLDDAGPIDGSSREVRVCVDGTRVYVVWEDTRNGFYDVYFNRSLDGGASWLPNDVRLDTDAEGVASSRRPRICGAGSRVYVVWRDDRDGEADIRFNGSLDDGATWFDDDRRLDTDAAGASVSTNPTLACRGDAVMVAWEDDRFGRPDILANRSLDGGDTWLAADRRLDRDGPGVSTSFAPHIAVDAETVHVVWYDDRDGDFDVLLSRSEDDGLTWLPAEVRLDTDAPGSAHSLSPRVQVVDREARVVWYDVRHGPGDIYFNRARPADE